MLNTIALAYSGSESGAQLAFYGFIVAGALVAAITSKSDVAMPRAPYFAIWGLTTLAVALSQLVWLGVNGAMIGGYLWALFIVDLCSGLLAGYLLCIVAMARSRDAYGHSRNAFLAFIPIANLWLLFTASKVGGVKRPVLVAPLLTGAVGIFLGLASLVAGRGISAFIQVEGPRIIEREQQHATSEDLTQMIRFIVTTRGLEKALEMMAEESSRGLPIDLDEITKLVSIRAQKETLVRTYSVDLVEPDFNPTFWDQIPNRICSHSPFSPLFEEGAQVVERYEDRNRNLIGEVSVDKNDCQ